MGRKRRYLLAAAVGLFLAACVLSGCMIGCEPSGERYYLRDRDGRIVFYHGVNVSNYQKYSEGFLPWHTKEDFARLRDWGFNAVRYLVFWEAIEPVEGQYDEAYLDKTFERIGWMADVGIDVLIDLHQDLYARKFSGDGFPEWTVDDDGREFTLRTPWNLNYLEPAVIASYTNFWKNEDLKAKYIAMLRHLLERAEGLPNIAGIEIMNEPFPALDLRFERRVLSPFYDDVIRMRREGGFTTPIYFEPMIFTSAGLPTRLNVATEEGCVYAPHYYGPLIHEGRDYTWLGRIWMRRSIRQRVRDGNRFRTPVAFTEFGISQEVSDSLGFLSDFVDMTSEYGVSWFYYCYDKTGDDGFGLLDSEGNARQLVKPLIRIYPQRIAGDRPRFATRGKVFEIRYDAIETNAPTVVFVPAEFDGVSVTFNGASIPFEPLQRFVTVANTPGQTEQSLTIRWE